MITPQLTEQYGQVDRVSLARAIFSVRSCAYAGCRSKPKTAAAAPPMVVSFRKSRRVGVMLGPPFSRGGGGGVSRELLIEIASGPVQGGGLKTRRNPPGGTF